MLYSTLKWLSFLSLLGRAGEFGRGSAGGTCSNNNCFGGFGIGGIQGGGGGGGGSISMFHSALRLCRTIPLQSQIAALLSIHGFAGNSTSMTFLRAQTLTMEASDVEVPQVYDGTQCYPRSHCRLQLSALPFHKIGGC